MKTAQLALSCQNRQEHDENYILVKGLSLQFHDFPAAHFDEINTDTLLQLAPMSLETWSDATKLGFKVVKTIMVDDVETKIESEMFVATKVV